MTRRETVSEESLLRSGYWPLCAKRKLSLPPQPLNSYSDGTFTPAAAADAEFLLEDVGFLRVQPPIK